MRNTSAILIFTLLLLISCKHIETPLETNARILKTLTESFNGKVDSLTKEKNIQKLLFLIDTNQQKYKHLIRLDSITLNRILKGDIIQESEIAFNFNPANSEFFSFDTLPTTFKDTAFIILQKEHIFIENQRLFLIRIFEDKVKIKLLASEDNYNCMYVSTMSALLGDTIIYTQKFSDAQSDVVGRNGKTWTVKINEIKKYSLKDNSYLMVDSTRINEYK